MHLYEQRVAAALHFSRSWLRGRLLVYLLPIIVRIEQGCMLVPLCATLWHPREPCELAWHCGIFFGFSFVAASAASSPGCSPVVCSAWLGGACSCSCSCSAGGVSWSSDIAATAVYALLLLKHSVAESNQPTRTCQVQAV